MKLARHRDFNFSMLRVNLPDGATRVLQGAASDIFWKTISPSGFLCSPRCPDGCVRFDDKLGLNLNPSLNSIVKALFSFLECFAQDRGLFNRFTSAVGGNACQPKNFHVHSTVTRILLTAAIDSSSS